MLVTGSPQFGTQDDLGEGDGVCAIQQWQCQFSTQKKNPNLLDFNALGLDHTIVNTVNRLRSVFGAFQTPEDPVILSTTDLHDLTCFTLHRLLSLPPLTGLDSQSTNISKCLRYGVSLYMFIIHGPTYYSHVKILNKLVLQLEYHLGPLLSFAERQDSLLVWFLSIGAIASIGTNESQRFRGRAATISIELGFRCWDDVETHLKRVLWLKTTARVLFRQTWKEIITSSSLLHSLAPA
jgi:hypothetical protein